MAKKITCECRCCTNYFKAKPHSSGECPICGEHYDNSDDWEEPFADQQPPGCAACGNPAWPDCEAGCPLMDDD